jgi:ABC-type uncharacterized transport system fused permease/ATPase subunit
MTSRCVTQAEVISTPDIPQISQRDLLEFLSYDLGMPTPQAILDELHLALPTLRHVLDFEGAWEDVLSETWKQLLAAARCMRYPDRRTINT